MGGGWGADAAAAALALLCDGGDGGNRGDADSEATAGETKFVLDMYVLLLL